MSDWVLELSENYEKAYKYYEKKHSGELAAVLNNLDSYVKALKNGLHPQFIQAGYIHHEPKGIKALDQKGSGKRQKLQQTRLYIYPNEEAKIVHLITIGDKSSQKNDIRLSVGFVETLKGGQGHGKAI